MTELCITIRWHGRRTQHLLHHLYRKISSGWCPEHGNQTLLRKLVPIYKSILRHIAEKKQQSSQLQPWEHQMSFNNIIYYSHTMHGDGRRISVHCAKFWSWKSKKVYYLVDLTVNDRMLLTLRRLMSYIYAAPILDVSRSHTTTQHSR